ncbi:MAG: hypothetical protein KatS3mg131_2520 [Candidatus Tectimicrobiota bacterium]|nr:MAG: hypothetical protein KatS3mg131_2520 [Candidatus Tectomicrobia bacterium]
MTSLAARLRRLLGLVQRGQLPRLLLIRDRRLRDIPATAKATRQYLKQLQESGQRLLRPSAEAYAALAAARRLLNEAEAGDLTVDGRDVSPGELKGPGCASTFLVPFRTSSLTCWKALRCLRRRSSASGSTWWVAGCCASRR